MPDPKSRARLERLLRGNFRPDDIKDLFLYLRDHCDGRETVADIGNFTAHHNERDRGITTRSTREWFVTARYCLAAGQSVDTQKLPPVAQDYFRIAVQRIDAKSIRDKIGLKHLQAHKIMLKLAERLTLNQDGTWALPSDCTQTELCLVRYISGLMIVKPAFDADRLSEEFLAVLKSNALITRQEIRTHETALKILVQLYAVAAMHNCVVQVGDGTTVQLKGGVWHGTKIEVGAAVPMQRVKLQAPIFEVPVSPQIHCHSDLLKHGAQGWDFVIELGADKRLAPLR